jgi:hypothetical protein
MEVYMKIVSVLLFSLVAYSAQAAEFYFEKQGVSLHIAGKNVDDYFTRPLLTNEWRPAAVSAFGDSQGYYTHCTVQESATTDMSISCTSYTGRQHNCYCPSTTPDEIAASLDHLIQKIKPD